MQMNSASQRHWSKVSKIPFGDKVYNGRFTERKSDTIIFVKEDGTRKQKEWIIGFTDKYRLVREDDLVFYICTSIEEVQSICYKLELSGNIRVLLRELPLTCEERHRLIAYVKRFLPLWIRVLQISLDASIVVRGILLLSHLTKHR